MQFGSQSGGQKLEILSGRGGGHVSPSACWYDIGSILVICAQRCLEMGTNIVCGLCAKIQLMGRMGSLFRCSWAKLFFSRSRKLVGCYNDAIVAMLALYDSAAVQLCRKLELRCFWVFA